MQKSVSGGNGTCPALQVLTTTDPFTREYVQTYMDDIIMHETHWPKGSLLTCMENLRLITTKMPPEQPPDGTHYLDMNDSTDPAAKHEKLLEYIIIAFR